LERVEGVEANDGDYWISDHIAEYKVKRAAQLTTVIASEKVAKGAMVTVTGKLSWANWEDLKYHTGSPGSRSSSSSGIRNQAAGSASAMGRLGLHVRSAARVDGSARRWGVDDEERGGVGPGVEMPEGSWSVGGTRRTW
jgi:hypothetical protein